MSDKQGNVPQFSDYEKELLLDGGFTAEQERPYVSVRAICKS